MKKLIACLLLATAPLVSAQFRERITNGSFGTDFDAREFDLFSLDYLNFGITAGSTGYGIRDNAGVIEYKSLTGSWAAIGGGGGGGGGSSFPMTFSLIKGNNIGGGLAALPNIDFSISSEQVATNVAVNWTSGKTMFSESVALTGDRATLLPPANAYAPGAIIWYVDSLTTMNFGRSFARSGTTDTLNGGPAAIVPIRAGGLNGVSVAKFKTNGTNAWQLIDTVARVIEVRDPVDPAKAFNFDATGLISGSPQSVRVTGASVTVKPEVFSSGTSQPFVIGVDGDGALQSASITTQDLPQQYLSDILPTQVNAVGGIAISAPTDTVRVASVPSGSVTIPWPAASAYQTGQSIRLYDVTGGLTATNRVQLQASGTDTIDGGATYDVSLPYINQLFTVSPDTGQWVSSKTSASSGGGGLSVGPFTTVPNSGGAATWTWNATRVRQNGNLQLASGTNTLSIPAVISGGTFELHVTQPASGAAGTLTLPAGSYTSGNGLGAITISSVNGKKDNLKGSFDGTNYWWDPPVLDFTGNTVVAAQPELLWWKLNDSPSTTSTTADVGPSGSTTTGVVWNTRGTGTSTPGVNSPFSISMNGGRTMTTTSNVTLGASNVVSVSFWIYDAVWHFNTDAQLVIGSATTQGAAKTFRLVQVGDGTTGKLRAELVNGGGSQRNETIVTTGVISTSTWHHVAIIYDNSIATGEITIYLDGVSQATTLNGGTTGTTPANFAANNLNIGAFSLSCNLDDIRIYNRGLTQSEVTTLALPANAN